MSISKNLNDGLRSRRCSVHVTTQRTIRQEVRRTITEEVTTTCFDYADFLVRVEEGDVTDEEYVEGYRNLVNSGIIRSLQGHHKRTAQQLIDNGVI